MVIGKKNKKLIAFDRSYIIANLKGTPISEFDWVHHYSTFIVYGYQPYYVHKDERGIMLFVKGRSKWFWSEGV